MGSVVGLGHCACELLHTGDGGRWVAVLEE